MCSLDTDKTHTYKQEGNMNNLLNLQLGKQITAAETILTQVLN